LDDYLRLVLSRLTFECFKDPFLPRIFTSRNSCRLEKRKDLQEDYAWQTRLVVDFERLNAKYSYAVSRGSLRIEDTVLVYCKMMRSSKTYWLLFLKSIDLNFIGISFQRRLTNEPCAHKIVNKDNYIINVILKKK